MSSQPQFPARLAFGPFEVDAAGGELRKGGVRVRLSGQPFQILLVLLAHPGELVSREQLREQVWSEGTFVDFEHGLNTAINKLRRALRDSPENPRYIETQPGRGYRFIGIVEPRHAAPIPFVAGSPIPENLPGTQSIRLWRWLAAAACVVSLAAGWLLHQSPAAARSWRLTQLTTDGFSYDPALSHDGKLVAYSSFVRGQEGNDLFIKQVAGGQPIRLTFDGAGNSMPDFSPDGSKIVFRSERDGGGIYEIPAFGGEVRLLAREGLNPKFSPDGSQVAYWVGEPLVALWVPGSGEVWVVPAAGGQPRRIEANFTNARFPIWSPDGRRLLLMGYTSAKTYERSSIDWWLAPANGGPAERTGAYEALAHAGMQGPDGSPLSKSPTTLARPGCWLAESNRVIFAAETGDTWNLWETGISPETGRVTGAFERLTAGAGREQAPSCTSRDVLAFTNVEVRQDIWAIPFDLDRGIPKGALERITDGGPAMRRCASLSSDARYLAFASDQSGRMSIWLRELATGKESRVASSPFLQQFPVVDASGGRIVFSSYENGKRLVYMSTPGGTPEKLCEGCLTPTDWSRDEKTLLVFGGSPEQINVLDVASHQQTALLQHPAHDSLSGRFSPDNRWVSFTFRTRPGRGQIMVAPIVGPRPVPESAWIKIAEDGAQDRSGWSPDGKTLYFTSGRDGHACLWGQPIDAGSHRPVGGAFAVQHFHGLTSLAEDGFSAAGGRIAMALKESTDNIWMMSRSGAR